MQYQQFVFRPRSRLESLESADRWLVRLAHLFQAAGADKAQVGAYPHLHHTSKIVYTKQTR